MKWTDEPSPDDAILCLLREGKTQEDAVALVNYRLNIVVRFERTDDGFLRVPYMGVWSSKDFWKGPIRIRRLGLNGKYGAVRLCGETIPKKNVEYRVLDDNERQLLRELLWRGVRNPQHADMAGEFIESLHVTLLDQMQTKDSEIYGQIIDTTVTADGGFKATIELNSDAVGDPYAPMEISQLASKTALFSTVPYVTYFDGENTYNAFLTKFTKIPDTHVSHLEVLKLYQDTMKDSTYEENWVDDGDS